jgi:hypothetical protein
MTLRNMRETACERLPCCVSIAHPNDAIGSLDFLFRAVSGSSALPYDGGAVDRTVESDSGNRYR